MSAVNFRPFSCFLNSHRETTQSRGSRGMNISEAKQQGGNMSDRCLVHGKCNKEGGHQQHDSQKGISSQANYSILQLLITLIRVQLNQASTQPLLKPRRRYLKSIYFSMADSSRCPPVPTTSFAGRVQSSSRVQTRALVSRQPSISTLPCSLFQIYACQD